MTMNEGSRFHRLNVELKISLIISSLNQIGSKMFECMPVLKYVDAINKTAVISFAAINLNKK